MSHTPVEIVGSVLFFCAIVHSFLIKKFHHIARRFKPNSVAYNTFYLLGEVEVVFGVWAAIFLLSFSFIHNSPSAILYLRELHFQEPLFVFVIMAVAATRPLVYCASILIKGLSSLLPFSRSFSFYAVALIIGPLLGSLMTEPAAMTVTALILKDEIFDRPVSERFKYVTLALLFVNTSIGGALTPFAAPPILMVAKTWGWDLSFMFQTFGWKAALAVVINTLIALILLRKELSHFSMKRHSINERSSIPHWLIISHIAFLLLIIGMENDPIIFSSIFVFFVLFTLITKKFQDALRFKESAFVFIFLSGLVILGAQQTWWLDSFLRSLKEGELFLGATLLTAVVDNAALTFLGAQIPDLSDALKYALVAGAVAGGGLSVIANAPNPIGFSILRENFGKEGISPLSLFLAALIPTIVAMGCFWLLP